MYIENCAFKQERLPALKQLIKRHVNVLGYLAQQYR